MSASAPSSAPPALVSFTVPGVPVPQGSKSAIVAKGRAVVVEGNRAKLRPWRAQVAAEAAAVVEAPLVGPLAVSLFFFFPRPAGHFGKGRNADLLRPSAPVYPGTRPDLDKLVRAVLDALTGIAFRDDAQVAHLVARKVYGSKPGAVVELRALE